MHVGCLFNMEVPFPQPPDFFFFLSLFLFFFLFFFFFPSFFLNEGCFYASTYLAVTCQGETDLPTFWGSWCRKGLDSGHEEPAGTDEIRDGSRRPL